MSSETSPTVGDVITTAGELDTAAIRARYVAWYNDTPGEASWPGRDEDESMERYIVRQHVRDLLDAADGPVDAATAGVDREALSTAVGGVLFNVMNYPEPVQARLLGQSIAPLTAKVVDAVLAFLATQPTPASDGHVCTTHCEQGKGHYPAPVDADAVERKVAAALREAAGASPREHRECGNACMFVHQARIALAAARAGEVQR